MSKAREIAEERLAEGKISEEEFDRLISKINANSQNNVLNSTNNQQQHLTHNSTSKENSTSKSYVIKTVLKLFGAFFFIIVLLLIGQSRYKSTIENQLNVCLNDPQISNSKCYCITNKFKEKISFLHETPLIGSIIRPSNDEMNIFQKQVINSCKSS